MVHEAGAQDTGVHHLLGRHAYRQVVITGCIANSMFGRTVFLLALALPLGCAIQPPGLVTSQSIEVAFSPEAGDEALVVKVLASAQQTIRLAGYSFTSPAVVKGLLDAKRRGVDVKVLLDDKGNRGSASLLAMKMINEPNIPLRVVSAYAIHYDKYIVVDGRHTETGSFNYSQAAARANSENVLVL